MSASCVGTNSAGLSDTRELSPEMKRLMPVIGSSAVAAISLASRPPPVARVSRTSQAVRWNISPSAMPPSVVLIEIVQRRVVGLAEVLPRAAAERGDAGRFPEAEAVGAAGGEVVVSLVGVAELVDHEIVQIPDPALLHVGPPRLRRDLRGHLAAREVRQFVKDVDDVVCENALPTLRRGQPSQARPSAIQGACFSFAIRESETEFATGGGTGGSVAALCA